MLTFHLFEGLKNEKTTIKITIFLASPKFYENFVIFIRMLPKMFAKDVNKFRNLT